MQDTTIRRNDKIKLAYLSSDFRRHAVAYLVAELFEWHDRTQFEVFGVSFGWLSGLRICREASKDQLQSELHFARWRGISGYLPGCRVSAQGSRWTRRPREDGCRGRTKRTGERKIRVVQDIKEFGAKLQIPVLANPGALEHCEIQVRKPRAV